MTMTVDDFGTRENRPPFGDAVVCIRGLA